MTTESPGAPVATCRICGDPLEIDVVFCAACGTPHHKTCFQWIGTCAVYACGGQRFTEDGSPATAPGSIVVLADETGPTAPSACATAPCEVPVSTLRQELAWVATQDTAAALLPLFLTLTAFDALPLRMEITFCASLVVALWFAIMYAASPRQAAYIIDVNRGLVLYGRSGRGEAKIVPVSRIAFVDSVGLAGRKRWCPDAGDYVDFRLVLRTADRREIAMSPPPDAAAVTRASAALSARAALEASLPRLGSDLSRPVEPFMMTGDRRTVDKAIWAAKAVAYVALVVFWLRRLL